MIRPASPPTEHHGDARPQRSAATSPGRSRRPPRSKMARPGGSAAQWPSPHRTFCTLSAAGAKRTGRIQPGGGTCGVPPARFPDLTAARVASARTKVPTAVPDEAQSYRDGHVGAQLHRSIICIRRSLVLGLRPGGVCSAGRSARGSVRPRPPATFS